ncbi:MAG: peptidylprolyl isomerase [bacterium]|nr:peptidylprolyl isomerase [bacterium]
MKARALGLDATPEIRKQVERVEDQLLVQRYLTHELAKGAPVAAGDVKLFYEAHPELFSAPARAQVTMVLHPTHAAAQKNLDALLAEAAPACAFTASVARTAAASNVVACVVDARGNAGAFGHEPALAAATLVQPVGLLTNVVATAKGYAVVNVTQHEPGALQPFAAVQPRVEQLYQDYKQQALLQSVLNDLQHTYPYPDHRHDGPRHAG